ncbi:uroporphyrinogen decarboxylase [Alicyclobacillus tolerans]|uniref:uroporphyrinogen decarboxylase n=1 Tax=Alicyclobacillus tolerans TaxID=90970 RepID=UPI001F00F6BB|nr:uroporphyrinogen decarboxylase [Alicyclobacillus tolerans]MCF8565804.1 uroporphyrinogen decarboxylase [Alicyclobacillus tolerans]
MISSDLFLQACRREPVTQVPVWYMRQAGRYQPEYRKIREKYSLVEICQIPELCSQVTKLPVTQLGVDAAILFSDIMIPVGAMGLDFEIKEGVGPIIDTPVRSAADVERLRVPDPEESLSHVLETIHMLRQDLTVPLIGFSGAPFTLASYMVEGGPSRHYVRTKQLMAGNTPVWNSLMNKLAEMVIVYMKAQIKAGAQAIQLFDSWVGSLAPDDFQTYVLPTMKHIFNALQETGVPLIYFGVTSGELLSMFAETGANVIGVDWRVPIRSARHRVGQAKALQGNLDPVMLFAPWPEIERRAKSILDAGLEENGFIFNLGHGVLPEVEVAVLQRLTAFVHEYSSQKW